MSEPVSAPISGPVLDSLIFSANAPVLYELQLSYARSSIFTKDVIPPVILGPNITGSVKMFNMNALSRVTGAFDYVRDGGGSIQSVDGGIGYNIFNIDASRSSALYSTSETVQPSSLIFNYVIKY